MKKINSIFTFLFLVAAAIITMNSCDKEKDENGIVLDLKNRNSIPSLDIQQDDYEKIGSAVYEYLTNYQGVISPEELFFSPEVGSEFKSEFDKVWNNYKTLPTGEILEDMLSKGYDTEQMRLYRYSIYDDLLNRISDVVPYLDFKFREIDQLGFSEYEKVIINP